MPIYKLKVTFTFVDPFMKTVQPDADPKLDYIIVDGAIDYDSRVVKCADEKGIEIGCIPFDNIKLIEYM